MPFCTVKTLILTQRVSILKVRQNTRTVLGIVGAVCRQRVGGWRGGVSEPAKRLERTAAPDTTVLPHTKTDGVHTCGTDTGPNANPKQ